MKRGRKLGKISLKVMEHLLEAGKVIAEELAFLPDIFDPRVSISKSFYNLQRSGYVEVKKDKKNQSFFHLTPKGKLSILKYLHLEKIRGKKWDGRWRIVIFDIPERLKKWREYLRIELKNLGFSALQESVYITPYPVTGELDRLLEEWNLRKYFRYITVYEIDGEDILKSKFGLK